MYAMCTRARIVCVCVCLCGAGGSLAGRVGTLQYQSDVLTLSVSGLPPMKSFEGVNQTNKRVCPSKIRSFTSWDVGGACDCPIQVDMGTPRSLCEPTAQASLPRPAALAGD